MNDMDFALPQQQTIASQDLLSTPNFQLLKTPSSKLQALS